MKAKRFGAILATLVSAAACLGASPAYIESDGTQFMNTGYYVGPQTKIEFDYAIANWAPTADYYQMRLLDNNASKQGGMQATVYIAGNANDGGSLGIAMGDRTAGQSLSGVWTRSECTSGVKSEYCDSNRRMITIDEPNKLMSISENGEVVWASQRKTAATKTAIWPLGLFGRTTEADGTSCDYQSRIRVYGLKIYEAGELVRDFSPVVKGGIAGLLDSKTGVFLYDTRAPGAGAFAYGGDIKTVADDGYVESTGKVGVNSRYFFNPKAKIEVDYALTDNTTAQQRIWGMDSRAPMASLYVQGNLNIAFGCGDTFVNSDTQTGIKADTLRHTAIIDVNNKTAAFVTGVTTNWSNNALLDTHVPSTAAKRPLGIFGNCTGESGTTFGDEHYCKVKIYGIKFFTDDKLVHDYVPCIQGGIVGFKDRVDGEFITSETVDELAYGGNIMTENGPAYIANNGKAYFDTGYKPTPHTRVEAEYLHTINYANYRVFGTYAKDALYMIHYVSGTTNYAWSCMDGAGNWKGTGIQVYSMRRRTFILDPHTDFVGLITAGYTNYSSTVSGPVAEKHGTYNSNAGATLCICSDAGGSSVSSMRLYGFKIYEAGELVRDYIPYLKNGVAGLYDRENGTFAGSSSATAFTIGGDFEFDQDAYIEGNGTQAFNTAYYMNKDARIEVDFSYTSVVASQSAIFGAWSCSNNRSVGFINGGSLFAMTLCDSNWTTKTFGAADTARHTAIIDAPRGNMHYVTGSTTNTVAIPNSYSDATPAQHPLGLMAGISNAAGSSWVQNGKARVYSFRIYETKNGVESLVHEYVPYKCGETIGLRDTKTGNILTDARNSSTPFVIGGMGVDGAEKWLVEPQAAVTLTKNGEPKTITANASGAQSYKWTKNGAAIEGGANGELTVSWEKRRTDNTVDKYTVTPVYNVFGLEVDGEPKTIEATNAPLGMMVILR